MSDGVWPLEEIGGVLHDEGVVELCDTKEEPLVFLRGLRRSQLGIGVTGCEHL